jgi:hypothetical protein
MDFPRVSCGRPSAVVLDLARYRTYLTGPGTSPLIVRTMPGFPPAALALMAEPPKVFACIARALEDLNKT